MPIPIDLSEVPSSDFKILPPGLYRAIITKVSEGKSKKAGHDEITVEFDIETGGRHSKVWGRFYPNIPTTLWRIAQFVTACGVDVSEGPVLITHEDYKGTRLILELKTKLYQGKESQDIGRFINADDEADFENINGSWGSVF